MSSYVKNVEEISTNTLHEPEQAEKMSNSENTPTNILELHSTVERMEGLFALKGKDLRTWDLQGTYTSDSSSCRPSPATTSCTTCSRRPRYRPICSRRHGLPELSADQIIKSHKVNIKYQAMLAVS